MTARTHYAVLGVAPGAAPDAVTAAYRPLAQRTHPDRGGVAGEWAAVAAAGRTLRDPARAAAYLAGLRAGVGACGACGGVGVRAGASGPRARARVHICSACGGTGAGGPEKII